MRGLERWWLRGRVTASGSRDKPHNTENTRQVLSCGHFAPRDTDINAGPCNAGCDPSTAAETQEDQEFEGQPKLHGELGARLGYMTIRKKEPIS